MNPFASLRDYETFVYTLRQQFSSIQHALLVVVPHGQRVAVLRGELLFEHGYRVTLRERVSWETSVGVIESYSYELWHSADKLAWYDSQPHPENPILASTFPHHKHVPPDIKHNRIPTPGISFLYPNLPVLIREIEALIQQTLAETNSTDQPKDNS